jgi:hypothetical protein
MASRKCVLKGTGIRNEYEAGGVITPGHLLTISSTSVVTVHILEGQNAVPRFAVEEDFLGRGIDDDYASGERCQTETLHIGQQINALVAASQVAIAIGDELTSGGDGTLRAVTAGSPTIGDEAVVAIALSTVASVAAIQRVVAEIV